MRDCRTCTHNTYREIETDFVSCCHPITIAKMPKHHAGDPAMVAHWTSDVHVSQIVRFCDCPTWEPGTNSLKDRLMVLHDETVAMLKGQPHD